MAMSPNFFNKREPISPAQRPGLSTSNVSSFGASASSSYPSSSDTPSAPVTEASQPVESSPVVTEGGGSKLTVGPNIKLKGVEITDCDTLVVEGLVEATMDSRVMQISEKGAFKGSAEIDIAEIHGHFDGNLTVRQKLIIFATGKVTGKVSYGKLVIEEGGQISGDIQFGAASGSKVNTVEKSGLSVAR